MGLVILQRVRCTNITWSALIHLQEARGVMITTLHQGGSMEHKISIRLNK